MFHLMLTVGIETRVKIISAVDLPEKSLREVFDYSTERMVMASPDEKLAHSFGVLRSFKMSRYLLSLGL